MKFLSPYAFYFAATIPVVVLFYLLKRKRVVKLVSSTLLWQRFLAETQANAPFQRLRHNWLLLLQILLLLLAVFALSRPYFSADTRKSALRVVILDASASMQSTDVAPSRFKKAQDEALRWVDSLQDEERMIVLQAAANTEVKQSATSEKASLRRAIESAAPSDSATRLKEALKLAETLTKDQADAEIHLFSDGAVGDLSEFENKGLNIVFHRIGERADNLGIVSLDAKANPENASQRAIYTSVQNFSDRVQQVTLELRFEDQVLEVRNLTIQAGQSSPQVFVATQARDGVFSVHLAGDDDLSADNQAAVVSVLPEPVKVLLVSQGNRFLEKALKAVPNVQLSLSQDSSDDARGFDLVILDNTVPTVWPRGNILAINVANTNWFEGVSRLENPPIVDWRNTHALLRYVNFDNVQIMEAMEVKAPSWGVSVVDSQRSPLMISGELDGRKIVWLAFETLQSTWPLRVSFPIFIANAVEWLNPVAAKNSELFVRAGEPFRLSLASENLQAEVTMPDGSKRPLALDAGAREVVFGDTSMQGTYRLRIGTNDTQFCVNLLDAAESDIKPKTELNFGKFIETETAAVKRASMEMWRWILIGALGVLMFEWWYYHRRTA